MITRREIAAIHVYAGLAGLDDGDYRALLHHAAGVTSSKALDQDGFERVMASLEATLWCRVEEGMVPDPRQNPKHAHLQVDHWRRRRPEKGVCNSRLRWKLERIWRELCPLLDPWDRSEGYLAAIIAHAGGIERDGWYVDGLIQWDRLPYRAAYLAVNALRDRLGYASRSVA